MSTYEQARKRAVAKFGLYIHAAAFLGVNIFLIILNFSHRSPEHLVYLASARLGNWPRRPLGNLRSVKIGQDNLFWTGLLRENYKKNRLRARNNYQIDRTELAQPNYFIDKQVVR